MDEEIALDLHLRGKQYIDHLSHIKLRYKKLALSWATAYLLGLSYITIYEEPIFHVSKFNLIFFITIFDILGIKLIQYLDINNGHAQLRSIFQYLLDFEKKHTSLIHPYRKVERLLYNAKFDPVLIDYFYYLGLNFGIALLGIAAQFLRLEKQFLTSLIVSVSCLLVFILWQVVTVVQLMRKRHSPHD